MPDPQEPGERLPPDVEESLRRQLGWLHDDIRAGRMGLAFGRDPRYASWEEAHDATGRLAVVPLVVVPWHWCRDRDDCPVHDLPEPRFPATCLCREDETDDHEPRRIRTRFWEEGCPDHGLGSGWRWEPEVREHFARREERAG